jgi:hypothetical protein
MLRDSLGRPASTEVELFAAWAEAWFTAEIERGVGLETARARFASALPLLISLLNATGVAREADAKLERIAS